MIEVEGLKMTYSLEHGEVQAVRDVGFRVEQGELFTLLGPSGSGKSSILRCIAGLERPHAGQITVGGRVVFSTQERGRKTFVPPEERGIGMVFQSYAVWPHMDVMGNVSFPLLHGTRKIKGKEHVRRAARDAIALVKLGGLEKRPVSQLSGGQQQRIALARALVEKPSTILLDEPLSNLDAKLREEMRMEIREIIQQVGTTAVYVTHDQTEAMAISDRIGVLAEGKLLQVGAPLDVYRNPATRFMAEFLGAVNVLDILESNPNGASGSIANTPIGPLHVGPLPEIGDGEPMVIGVRPEYVMCSRERPAGGENVFEGTVSRAAFLGSIVDTRIQVNGMSLQAALRIHEAVDPGSPVYVRIPREGCLVLR